MTTARRFEAPAERAAYPPECAICGGPVAERSVTLSLSEPGGEPRIVHHVPVGVCDTCGERYLTSAVVRKIEELLETPPTRHQEIPI